MRIETTRKRNRGGWLNRMAVVALVGLALPLVACDDEDDDNGVGPDDDGAASVRATDSPDGSPAEVGSGMQVNFAIADATGTFTGDASATLVAQGGTDVSLEDEADVNVNLQAGDTTTVVASTDVPAQTYTGFEITLSNVSVDVASGSTIGAGPISLTSDITVTVANDEDVVITGTFATPQNVTAGATLNAVVDLNSSVWLDAVTDVDETAGSGSVAASAIADAAVVTATTVSGGS